MFNRMTFASNVTFEIESLGLKGCTGNMRDLINRKDLGPTQPSYTVLVKPHHVHVIRIKDLF
jgi:hypothetical protein